MIPIDLICFKCKNFTLMGCPAFPDFEIPEEITSGENKHKKPLPGQGNDIVFTPKTEEDELFIVG